MVKLNVLLVGDTRTNLQRIKQMGNFNSFNGQRDGYFYRIEMQIGINDQITVEITCTR